MQRWEYASCQFFDGAVVSSMIHGQSKVYIQDIYKFRDGSQKDREKATTELIWFVDFANRLGAEGWELVSIAPRVIPLSGVNGNQVHYHGGLSPLTLMAVFKRPLA